MYILILIDPEIKVIFFHILKLNIPYISTYNKYNINSFEATVSTGNDGEIHAPCDNVSTCETAPSYKITPTV